MAADESDTNRSASPASPAPAPAGSVSPSLSKLSKDPLSASKIQPPAAASPVTSEAALTTATTSTTPTAPTSKKRTGSISDSNGAPKVTKRRAARACVSCRARKVRCDVVEGAPCGNCRWDNVECVVQESRRRKKNIFPAPAAGGHVHGGAEALHPKIFSASNPISISSADELRRPSSVSLAGGIDTNGGVAVSVGMVDSLDGQVSPLIYPRTAGYPTDTAALLSKLGEANSRLLWSSPTLNQPSLLGDFRTAQFLNALEEPDLLGQLPPFIKPLPPKLAREDVRYLHAKGALTLPNLSFQNALLKAYVEYVHPFMPLLELYDFLSIVNNRDGLTGQISLFLYQAVMFVASAFVESKYLREAGYSSRKAARKAFFTRTRLLYDLDYESDRLVLVQALLLMTYWYETPDDQKDTWHWMGVAISLAHTIGLHRNPVNTNMTLEKQKLWKRIWWSCFMRDRLIALGMRRPTRIKEEDFDVPMLDENDFEIEVLHDNSQLLSPECTLVRDVDMQRQLALMCIEKAKLCICISHMLKAQYSVLNRDLVRTDSTSGQNSMLFPNKALDNVESVHLVDMELMTWYSNLPPCCQYRPLTPYDIKDGRATLAVQRNLLHMVYQTTVSALHRPQFLPTSPSQTPTASRQVQEMSRVRVRDAAGHITQMATELHHLRLERYLPTTGVTVILPAMIIHLLDMKSPYPDARAKATRGFRQCMRVMGKLREIYAAADFATGFLDAALRKAAIEVPAGAGLHQQFQRHHDAKSLNGVLTPGLNLISGPVSNFEKLSTPPPENAPYLNATEVHLYHQNRTYMPRDADGNAALVHGHSPPPTEKESDSAGVMTPSASGSSEEPPMDVDVGLQKDDYDWNTVTGAYLDFDQWLQFPAEGVNNSDETFMGMFDGKEQIGKGTDQEMDWIASS